MRREQRFHETVALNGYLYCVSGTNGVARYASTLHAPIMAGGGPGSWSTSADLAAGIESHAAISWNGRIYTTGGYNGADQATVEFSNIEADGTTGAWASAGVTFATARAQHGTLAYNGYLYVLGGAISGVPQNDVQYAPINPNGTLGAFAATSAFSTGRRLHAVAAYNGYMFVLGGIDGSGFQLSDVQFAAINSNGTVGGWTGTTAFTTARGGLGATTPLLTYPDTPDRVCTIHC
ncbi:MAG: hypothetical protein HYY93_09655 [Planctomycetes bacterium]|nr:hypothetical protein [Planctomycetota bacterium]